MSLFQFATAVDQDEPCVGGMWPLIALILSICSVHKKSDTKRCPAGGEQSLCNIAEMIDVCYRQAKSLYRRYREEGPSGLVHRSVGGASHRRIDEALRLKVIDAYRER